MVPKVPELSFVVLFIVMLLLFGPKKLPEVSFALGKSIQEFRKGIKEA